MEAGDAAAWVGMWHRAERAAVRAGGGPAVGWCGGAQRPAMALVGRERGS